MRLRKWDKRDGVLCTGEDGPMQGMWAGFGLGISPEGISGYGGNPRLVPKVRISPKDALKRKLLI